MKPDKFTQAVLDGNKGERPPLIDQVREWIRATVADMAECDTAAVQRLQKHLAELQFLLDMEANK